MPVPSEADRRRSQTAPRLDERPWYLSATPLATLPWLVRLRWTSAGFASVILAVSFLAPEFDFPMRGASPLIALFAISNALVAISLMRERALPRPVQGAAMALDVALLTALLELTGGPFNPFSVIFLVQITLASLTLGQFYAAGIGAAAAVGYGLLVYWHTIELDPVHHRLSDFPTHLFTMWIAVAVTAELVAYFVVQASNALAQREDELEAMRERAARTEHLVSLTTLAAGAAHELSTPLGTIALAARELERAAAASAANPSLSEDARLIRTEVDRCRAILDQMSGRAVGGAAETLPIELASVMADVRARLPEALAGRLDVRLPERHEPVHLSREGLAQAVFSLVKNAFDATGASQSAVEVDVTQDAGRTRITVRDRGHGMPHDVLQRAGEPFFTTKEPGRGLGLGLFLARVFAERVGGALTLHSQEGTTASLELPTRSG